MTGNPNVCLMSRSRATVSLPCSCRISGCSASTMLASVASSASTVSATFDGAAFGLPAEIARRLQAEMTGRGRKEHESHHVRAGLQRDVERLARGQAANFDDQGHGSGHGLGRRRQRRKSDRDGPRSTTSRPACLARRPHIRRPAAGPEGAADRTARASAPARRSASCARACRASASCWRAARRQCRCRNQVAEPPATTPSNRHRDDDDEQRQRDRDRWIAGIERIERHRHQMTIGDREDDEDQAQRNQHQGREEFSHDHLSR